MTLLDYDKQLSLAANHLTGHSAFMDNIFKFCASYLVYLIPVILLYIWYRKPDLRLLAMRAFGAGLIGWVGLNTLVSHIWFRSRPDLNILGVHELLFHQPIKSFPSDHATFGMAIALMFLLAGQKKIGWLFFWLTIIFSAARVIVAVHYPLDIVGGYVTAVIMVAVVTYLQKPIDQYIGQPIIALLKKIKLA